jgi:hypothetical protein
MHFFHKVTDAWHTSLDQHGEDHFAIDIFVKMATGAVVSMTFHFRDANKASDFLSAMRQADIGKGDDARSDVAFSFHNVVSSSGSFEPSGISFTTKDYTRDCMASHNLRFFWD